MRQIVDACPPRIGAFGVYGNHDTADLLRRLVDLPVRWLNNEAWHSEDLPLTVLGVECEGYTFHGDLLGTLLHEGPVDRASRRFRLLLAHAPGWLSPASEVGIDLVLSGHTHGGQVRLPRGRILYNGMDSWPKRLTAGVMQRRRTFSVISRGLGEAYLERLRLWCPPHVLLITLRRATGPIESTDLPVARQRW